MPHIRSATDAEYHAQRNHPDAEVFEPIRDGGQLIGWTFSLGSGDYGWILIDGRISSSTEPYRS